VESDNSPVAQAENLQYALLLGPTLFDRSPLGQMKDEYALRLFTLTNLLKLIEKTAALDHFDDRNTYSKYTP
jgi:hypothetical protein